MNAFDVDQEIGEIVAQKPAASHALEGMGIDYCCGGTKSVEDVCREKGLDPQLFLKRLEECEPAKSVPTPPFDASDMSLTELVDHIEQTHHVYLRNELPRIAEMTNEMVTMHAGQDPRLHFVQTTFRAMSGELWSHMMKEEMCLFPLIRQLEACDEPTKFHVGSIADPIRRMELEHDEADSALERLREYTDGFKPPSWACKVYRAMLEGLNRLEQDMHVHIHKENNILFPRALELEMRRRKSTPVV